MICLSPARHFLAWTHGSHEGLCKAGCVLGARGGEGTFPCSLKDFCQEILDRRRMFIISDILKCRKLAGIFFPVPCAFNSSTLTPSTAKILSYPMRSSLNDSNDLFSIKPDLSPCACNRLLKLTTPYLWARWHFLFSVWYYHFFLHRPASFPSLAYHIYLLNLMD